MGIVYDYILGQTKYLVKESDWIISRPKVEWTCVILADILVFVVQRIEREPPKF